MEWFGIGEIARRSGVAASAIRYYEEIGLLPPAKRVNTKRRYDDSILQKISLIRMAQQAGLSIAEIQILLHADIPPSERWQSLATQKIGELNALISQAQNMKSLLEKTLECHCAVIEDCANVQENSVESNCGA